MKPCISEATTMPSSFAEDVAQYADAGLTGMEVWLTKLEKHLETSSASDTRQLLADRKMELAAASYQGGLMLSQGEQRKAHYDHFRRRLDLCQEFQIGTMLLTGDFGEKIDIDALVRATASLKEAAQWAAGFGVTLALEFRAGSAFCSSLDTAVALVCETEEPNIGVNFDVFHYYTGPSKLEDLQAMPLERLAFVQVSDLPGVPRELARDADRVLPGDGDFQLGSIVQCLRDKGYDGWVSLELLNPILWQSNPAQVAQIGAKALNRLLGLD